MLLHSDGQAKLIQLSSTVIVVLTDMRHRCVPLLVRLL